MLTSYEEYLFLLDGKEKDATQNWAMVRWLGWWEEQLSPYVKAGQKHKTPLDLFLLPDEKKPVKGHLSGEIDKVTLGTLNSIYEDFYKQKISN